MNTTPTLEMLDPATLTVDINVRKDAALTADFIASIKEHGVMEPVIAHRKDDGDRARPDGTAPHPRRRRSRTTPASR